MKALMAIVGVVLLAWGVAEFVQLNVCFGVALFGGSLVTFVISASIAAGTDSYDDNHTEERRQRHAVITVKLPSGRQRSSSGTRRVDAESEGDPSHFYTKIRGVSRRRKAVGNCDPGEPLTLKREPGNKADPNAVMIFNEEGELVGYLSRYRAEQVAPMLDAGDRFAARVAQVTGEEHDNLGVNIEVWRIGR